MPGKTPQQKLQDWAAVYVLIRDELTPEWQQQAIRLMMEVKDDNGIPLRSALEGSRIVNANNRAAAIAAAILTSTGMARTAAAALDYTEEGSSDD